MNKFNENIRTVSEKIDLEILTYKDDKLIKDET